MPLAYHFLCDDWRASSGAEPAWRIGEERTWGGPIRLCQSGYHSSPSWYDALSYAPGAVACVVEVSEPVERDTDKQVSATRKLVAGKNVERELRLFAADCAERALLREREVGREPDERSWRAIATARAFAKGKTTVEELAAARDAARAAAWAAAWVAAWAAARAAAWDAARAAAWAAAWVAAWAAARAAAWAAAWDAAWVAARDAAWAAAWDAERQWQAKHLALMLDKGVQP